MTSRTCTACPKIQCNAKVSTTASSSSGGVNAGIVAGPIVAVLLLAALSVGMWWLWKRRKAQDMKALDNYEKRMTGQASRRTHQSGQTHSTLSPLPDLGPRTGMPFLSNSASGEFPRDVRPSMDTFAAHGTGVNRRVYEGDGDIDLSRSRGTGDDPFDDRRSVATDQLSFGSTNVIPIAYVPPEERKEETRQKQMTAGEKLDAARRALGVLGRPNRPARSPDLDLRLKPTAGIHQALGPKESVETLGASAPTSFPYSSSRASVLTARTDASFAPSFSSAQSAFEAPQIVTRRDVQTGVVQQAAVVDLNTPTNANWGRNLTAIDTRTVGGSTSERSPDPSLNSAMSRVSGSGLSTRSDPFSDLKGDRGSNATFGRMMMAGSSQGHELDDEDTQGNVYDGQGSVSDLRFSMGTLTGGVRDSVASNVTGLSVGQVKFVEAKRVNLGPSRLAPPGGVSPPTAYSEPSGNAPRDSIMSGRSDADSFLNAIIPPRAHYSSMTTQSPLPTDMSSSRLDPEDGGARKTMMSGLSGFDFAFEGDAFRSSPQRPI